MAQKEEGYNVSELGNWNVASDYSRIKIMKPLDHADHYENIARFGSDTFFEQLENYGIPLDTLKLIGFERLVNQLITLCDNSMFAMKVAKTKEDMQKLQNQLKEVRKHLGLLSKIITKQGKQELILQKVKYHKALDFVSDIKAKINEPLNKNHLIFTDKEEFDPKKYKEQIIKGAIEKG